MKFGGRRRWPTLSDIVLDFKEAVPFTSMMSLDVEKELGIEFDKARLHGHFSSCMSRNKAD